MGRSSVLGENLMYKRPLVKGREREQRREFLKHLPEKHGNTRKDAEFSLESDHGLFRSVRSQSWHAGSRFSQSRYLGRQKEFQLCWGIKPSDAERISAPYSGAKPRHGSCWFLSFCRESPRGMLILVQMPSPMIHR